MTIFWVSMFVFGGIASPEVESRGGDDGPETIVLGKLLSYLYRRSLTSLDTLKLMVSKRYLLSNMPIFSISV